MIRHDIFKNITNELNTILTSQSNYSIPIDNNNIRSNLEVKNQKKVDDLLRDLKLLDEFKFFQDLESTIRHDGMNPHKDYFPLQYYVETQAQLKLYNAILNCINKDITRCILHIGNKGSGKTLTQNVLLKNKHEELEKINVLWIRCDVHKIYQMARSVKINKLISIDDYLKIRLIYVFCKYYKRSQIIEEHSLLMGKIFDELNNNNHKTKIQVDKIGDNTREFYTCKLIEKFLKNIIDKESNNKGYSYSISEIILGSKGSTTQRARRQWLQLADSFLNFIKTNDIYKILFIVDGADNIDWSKKGSGEFFVKALKELANFITLRNQNNNVYNLATLRPKTEAEINKLIIEQTDTSTYLTYSEYEKINQCINLDNVNLVDLLKKRYEFVINNKSINKSFDSFKVINNIIQYVINIDSIKPVGSDFYHNNYRNYLYNRIGLIKLIYFRSIHLENKFELIKQYNNLIKRSYFLHDRLFMDSSLKYNVNSGDYSFNLFRYSLRGLSSNITPDKWYGLYLIRVLQYLKYNKDKSTLENKLIEDLNRYFGYPIKLLTKGLYALKGFGLVDSEAKIYGKLTKRKINLYLNISTKGLGVYNLIFQNIDVLYILLLDSLLPEELIKNKYVEGYSNLLSNVTNFEKGCVKSCISFIVFLKIVELNEKIKYDKYYNNIKYDDIFKLPIEENEKKYLRSLNYFYKKLRNNSTFNYDFEFNKIFNVRPFVNINSNVSKLYSDINNNEKKIFIVYPRKSLRIVNELMPHLSAVKNSTVWYDKKIGFGQDWKQKIMDHISTSRYAILIIDKYFFDSEFIMKEELLQIEEMYNSDKIRIFPILYGPVHFPKDIFLNKLQFLDEKPLIKFKKDERDERFAKLAKQLDDFE